MKYGFFSQQAKDIGGSVFYLNKDGHEVEVTVVSDDKDIKDYDWPDIVFVGEVIGYSRGEISLNTHSRHIFHSNYEKPTIMDEEIKGIYTQFIKEYPVKLEKGDSNASSVRNTAQ